MKFDFEKDIVLENEEVLLKPIVRDDFNNLLEIAINHPHLLQYSPRQINTPALLEAYIENALTEREKRTRYSFSIFSKAGNCFAGSSAFMTVSDTDERLEIGATWIDPKVQGTGLNRACKFLLLRYAFETAGAHRVEFRTDARNTRSQKAIEKIGGKLEGALREHMMMPDGFRRTSFLYSILRHEWEQDKKHG